MSEAGGSSSSESRKERLAAELSHCLEENAGLWHVNGGRLIDLLRELVHEKINRDQFKIAYATQVDSDVPLPDDILAKIWELRGFLRESPCRGHHFFFLGVRRQLSQEQAGVMKAEAVEVVKEEPADAGYEDAPATRKRRIAREQWTCLCERRFHAYVPLVVHADNCTKLTRLPQIDELPADFLAKMKAPGLSSKDLYEAWNSLIPPPPPDCPPAVSAPSLPPGQQPPPPFYASTTPIAPQRPPHFLPAQQQRPAFPGPPQPGQLGYPNQPQPQPGPPGFPAGLFPPGPFPFPQQNFPPSSGPSGFPPSNPAFQPSNPPFQPSNPAFRQSNPPFQPSNPAFPPASAPSGLSSGLSAPLPLPAELIPLLTSIRREMEQLGMKVEQSVVRMNGLEKKLLEVQNQLINNQHQVLDKLEENKARPSFQ